MPPLFMPLRHRRSPLPRCLSAWRTIAPPDSAPRLRAASAAADFRPLTAARDGFRFAGAPPRTLPPGALYAADAAEKAASAAPPARELPLPTSFRRHSAAGDIMRMPSRISTPPMPQADDTPAAQPFYADAERFSRHAFHRFTSGSMSRRASETPRRH